MWPRTRRTASSSCSPNATPGNLQRLTTPVGAQTVTFTWQPNQVDFAAGGTAWTYAGASVPLPTASVHMNLWLDAGRPPTDRKAVDVVLTGFSHTP